MSTAVAASQRYTRDRRCPICGGAEADPRGQAKRCIGYLSPDGEYARCSRDEHAGALAIEDATETYVHRLTGDCRCGQRHGAADATRSKQREEILAVYRYLDEKGAHLYDVLRIAPKTFRPRRPDGKRTLDGVRRVLYRLPELLAADPGETVFVVEGEKDCDNLRRLGMVATTNSGGAGKWRPEYNDALRGRRVVVIQDCDDESARFAGQRHAEQVAKALADVAASVKVLALPGPGKDASDWIAGGGTADQVRDLVRHVETPVPATKGPTRIAMSTIEPRPVSWMWRDRIPAGAVATLEGYPGAGKSTLATEFVACVTTGRPLYGDATARARSSMWIGHEESPATALRPRLDAAGADVARVFIYRDPPSFPADYDWLRDEIRATDTGLVVIDPIDAYLDFGAKGDSHRNGDVRARLRDLAVVAEDTGTTIVMIRHFRKSGGVHAVYRSAGSLAFSAMARVMISVMVDPEDEHRRIAAWSKMSDAVEPQSLAFRIGVSRTVIWIGEDDRSAQALMDRGDDRREERDSPVLGSAIEWLRGQLAAGRVLASELSERATGAGINGKTLQRARERVGARAVKRGRIWWVEPGQTAQEGQTPPRGNVVPLVHLVRDDPAQERQQRQEGQDPLLRGPVLLPDRQPGEDDDDPQPPRGPS